MISLREFEQFQPSGPDPDPGGRIRIQLWAEMVLRGIALEFSISARLKDHGGVLKSLASIRAFEAALRAFNAELGISGRFAEKVADLRHPLVTSVLQSSDDAPDPELVARLLGELREFMKPLP